MKVGVLSDIHANKYALTNVLERAGDLGVDKLLILGDIVGYYYAPDEVLNMLSSWECEFIQGNHERMLLKALDDENYLDYLTINYGSSYEQACVKLDNKQIDFLRSLPKTKELIIDDTSLLMSHGTPTEKDYYLYPDASKNVFDNISMLNVDFVLMGHTHHRLNYTNNNTSLVNFGSVGQSREVGGIAEWGIIDTVNKVTRNISTLYNQDELASMVIKNDPTFLKLKDILYRNNKEIS